ncbi:hypothetical protein ILYODFUR_020304 [Ilyodon furcidens]|uniref:Uncharacterized protein n=1 Tax=Ilyodon furcidens TaxID=33524 RepID=A0ABV0U6Y2_9TELE
MQTITFITAESGRLIRPPSESPQCQLSSLRHLLSWEESSQGPVNQSGLDVRYIVTLHSHLKNIFYDFLKATFFTLKRDQKSEQFIKKAKYYLMPEIVFRLQFSDYSYTVKAG